MRPNEPQPEVPASRPPVTGGAGPAPRQVSAGKPSGDRPSRSRPSGDRPSGNRSSQDPPPEKYEQELSRSLKVVGNMAIVVAAITPASSAFVIAAVVFAISGSGAALAFAVAAVLGIAMAFCWAELGAAYPLAGGDYSFIARTLGRASGFVSLVLTGPVQAILIPAVIALGMAEYLETVFSADANVIGAVVIAVSTVIAVFGIKFSALATGVLLLLELAAVALVTVLGFVNAERPITELFNPQLFDADGTATSLTAGALIAGVAVASFAYNGFQGAILFSEETQGPARNIARAVFGALVVAVLAELLPVAAALLGSPSVAELTTSDSPWQYFLTSIGGETFNTVISLGIAIAILNGVIALMPYFARILYSSGRDMVWPAPVSRALATVHPRYQTPWIATLIIGAAGTALILVADVVTLTTWVGATVAIEYSLVATAAVVSRIRRRDLERPYRMPWWPLPPLVGLAISLLVLSEQTGRDLFIATAIVGGALLYYAFYLRPRAATHMLTLAPPDAGTDTGTGTEVGTDTGTGTDGGTDTGSGTGTDAGGAPASAPARSSEPGERP
ncbi:APC family permease [Streptomyces sp. NPDC051018]|uniref:APC family permease n=1 Tax=Streptomyces sp. NPDC051018 TaxID=3365639 RepID=UPI00378AABFD